MFRKFLALSVVTLSFALPSLAQGLGDLQSGALVPSPQSAAANDAYSAFVNPAGLGYVNGFQLVAGYSGRYGPSAEDHIYSALAFGLFDGLTLGFDAAALIAPVGTKPGGLSFGTTFALRLSDGFSLGFRPNFINDFRAGSSADFMSDFSFSARLSSWLALGGSLESIGALRPRQPSARLGLSLRPLGDRLTLGADARVRGGSDDLLSSAFVSQAEITPSFSARLQLGGLGLIAAVGLPNALRSEALGVEASAGIVIDTAHLGATLLGGWRSDDQAHAGFSARVSSESFDSLFGGGNQWRVFALTGKGTLAGGGGGGGGLSNIFSSGPDPERVVAALYEAALDESVAGIVVRLRGLSVGWGRAAEIRQALLAVKDANKTVVVHLESADDLDLYLASAASQIYAAPVANIALDGLRVELVYFKTLLDKLGIHAEAFTAGDYKLAPRSFTHDSSSPEQLEVENSLLDSTFKSLVDAISTGREIPQEKVLELIDRGGMGAPDALAENLIDGMLYFDELADTMEKQVGYKPNLDFDFIDDLDATKSWKSPPQIAVVPIHGEIQYGGGSSGLFSSRGAGSDTLIQQLASIGADDRIKGVVLRIDSPGGSALASDLIWNAVRKLDKKKPVIVSMADVAASGGYYIAAAAREIFAQPETITGSIGVFALGFEASEMANEVGIKREELKRGALPGGTVLRTTSPEERARTEALVQQTYERFLDAIVEGRGIEKEALRQVAGGRVWTGAQAKERGLIDNLGGLDDAIKRAAEVAGITGREEEVIIFSSDTPGMSSLLKKVQSMALSDDKRAMKRALETIFGDLSAIEIAAQADKPMTRMPSEPRVR